MTISIHQPNHFPYLGFFQKVSMSDIFVILDDVKYSKNEFYHRNKFKNKSGNDEWFSMIVEKGAHNKLINEVLLADSKLWKKKLLRKLELAFKEDFSEIYSFDKLVDVNMASIKYCMEKLNISTPLILSSSLKVKQTSSQRLVNICKKLNATKYIAGPMAHTYLDESLFENIEVVYQKLEVPNYYSTLYNLFTQ